MFVAVWTVLVCRARRRRAVMADNEKQAYYARDERVSWPSPHGALAPPKYSRGESGGDGVYLPASSLPHYQGTRQPTGPAVVSLCPTCSTETPEC